MHRSRLYSFGVEKQSIEKDDLNSNLPVKNPNYIRIDINELLVWKIAKFVIYIPVFALRV